MSEAEEGENLTGHHSLGGLPHRAHSATSGAENSPAEQSQQNMVQRSTTTPAGCPQADTPVPAKNPTLISDLCQAMRQTTVAQQSLGWLPDPRSSYHNFSTTKASMDFLGYPECGTTSLKELLEGDISLFPPKIRYAVAAILASSLLQLQRTPWLADR
ncbi:hypothetical protein N431DRAFT_521917 [Stipitochalara longipes BDJ]|nr:hypothetical protein N431DRAFT_521917 [Stipitochalara longipes BDJ]